VCEVGKRDHQATDIASVSSWCAECKQEQQDYLDTGDGRFGATVKKLETSPLIIFNSHKVLGIRPLRSHVMSG
jgi:hypothetical protein